MTYEDQLWSEGFVALVATASILWVGFIILYIFHPFARSTLSKYKEQIRMASIMLGSAILVAYTLASGDASGDKSAFAIYQTLTGVVYWLAIGIVEFGFSVHKYSRGRIDWRTISVMTASLILLGYYANLMLTLPSP